jgi:hypothetical protein
MLFLREERLQGHPEDLAIGRLKDQFVWQNRAKVWPDFVSFAQSLVR